DGIRDFHVTGVQTCALPIFADGVFVGPAAVLTNDTHPRAINPDGSLKSADDWEPVGVTVGTGAAIGARAVCVAPVRIGEWATVRSEERRVGRGGRRRREPVL